MGYYIAYFNTSAYAIRGSHGYHLINPDRWETVANEVREQRASSSANYKAAVTDADRALSAISDFGLLYFGSYPSGPIDMSTALKHRESLAIEREFHQDILARLTNSDFNFSASEVRGAYSNGIDASGMLRLFLSGCAIATERRNGILRIVKKSGRLSRMLGSESHTLGMYPEADISDVRVEPERVDITLGTGGGIVITRDTCEFYG